MEEITGNIALTSLLLFVVVFVYIALMPIMKSEGLNVSDNNKTTSVVLLLLCFASLIVSTIIKIWI